MEKDLSGYIGNLDVIILERIREERERQKISRKQLCDDLGLKHSTYSDLETGKIKFDLTRLLAVLKYLGIDDIFQKTEEETSLQVLHDPEQFMEKFSKMEGDVSDVKKDMAALKNVLQQILDKLNEGEG